MKSNEVVELVREAMPPRWEWRAWCEGKTIRVAIISAPVELLKLDSALCGFEHENGYSRVCRTTYEYAPEWAQPEAGYILRIYDSMLARRVMTDAVDEDGEQYYRHNFFAELFIGHWSQPFECTATAEPVPAAKVGMGYRAGKLFAEFANRVRGL